MNGLQREQMELAEGVDFPDRTSEIHAPTVIHPSVLNYPAGFNHCT